MRSSTIILTLSILALSLQTIAYCGDDSLTKDESTSQIIETTVNNDKTRVTIADIVKEELAVAIKNLNLKLLSDEDNVVDTISAKQQEDKDKELGDKVKEELNKALRNTGSEVMQPLMEAMRKIVKEEIDKTGIYL